MGLLPGVVRHDPGHLTGQIDPGGLAEAEFVSPVGQPLDTEHAGDLEEEGVARVGEAELDRDRTPAPMVPLPELRPAQQEVGTGVDEARGRDLAVGKGAAPADELVGRSGRVVGLDGVVQERLVLVVEELAVILGADPRRERVVVIGREADHREDLAGLRVHHDDDTALEAGGAHAPLEGSLGVLLLLDVDRQLQRVARLLLARGLEDLELAARRVALHRLAPVDAPQRGLVVGLDPGLSDEIVGKVPLLRERLELTGRHGPRVAEQL